MVALLYLCSHKTKSLTNDFFHLKQMIFNGSKINNTMKVHVYLEFDSILSCNMSVQEGRILKWHYDSLDETVIRYITFWSASCTHFIVPLKCSGISRLKRCAAFWSLHESTIFARASGAFCLTNASPPLFSNFVCLIHSFASRVQNSFSCECVPSLVLQRADLYTEVRFQSTCDQSLVSQIRG